MYNRKVLRKLDEAVDEAFDQLVVLANSFLAIDKTKKSITYFSIGQNVPDDLIAADASFLIDCFMNNECSKEI